MAPQLPRAVSESPAYDGDSESAVGSTLKGLDAYLLPMINNKDNHSQCESTLKASEKTIMKDKPLPIPTIQAPQMSNEVSSSSITSIKTTTDEGGEYDTDGDSDGDDKSLWAVSLGGPKPKLEIRTETAKPPPPAPSAVQFPRSSPGVPMVNFPHPVANNFPHPPPNFPPPAPPHSLSSARLRGRKTKASKSHRDSQFIKAHENTWSYRPPPEEITERLDTFFPDHDLDEEIIDSTPGGSSPTTAQPASRNFQPMEKEKDKEKDKKSKHKKSIRYVASEAKKRIDRNSKSDSSTMSTMLKRRNTKLWGSKLEEVTSSQITPIPNIPPPVSESPTTQNPKREFRLSQSV